MTMKTGMNPHQLTTLSVRIGTNLRQWTQRMEIILVSRPHPWNGTTSRMTGTTHLHSPCKTGQKCHYQKFLVDRRSKNGVTLLRRCVRTGKNLHLLPTTMMTVPPNLSAHRLHLLCPKTGMSLPLNIQWTVCLHGPSFPHPPQLPTLLIPRPLPLPVPPIPVLLHLAFAIEIFVTPSTRSTCPHPRRTTPCPMGGVIKTLITQRRQHGLVWEKTRDSVRAVAVLVSRR